MLEIKTRQTRKKLEADWIIKNGSPELQVSNLTCRRHRYGFVIVDAGNAN